MVKAAAGGGGRGMRLVHGRARSRQCVGKGAIAKRRARSDRDELILERAIGDARHIEFQIFADRHGNVVHLGERDCSIQRRHQKVIEEAPSPAMSTELRREWARRRSPRRAPSTIGAPARSSFCSPEGQFYFLEMNTRLQVEHPVTEAVAGLDLVASQLNVAAGEKLPLEQQQVVFGGHAIEARLYAEDPENGFLPQSGKLIDWRPAGGEGVRIDHGLAPGCMVSPFYDPMLAKLIAHGGTREEARRRLIMALEDTVVLGLKTNRSLLIAMLRHPAFAAGEVTTAFIDQYFPTGGDTGRAAQPSSRILALAAVLLFEARARSAPGDAGAAQRWSSTGVADWPLRLRLGDAHHAVSVTVVGTNDYLIVLGSERVEVAIVHRDDGIVRFDISGVQQNARFAVRDDALYLDLDGDVFEVRDTTLAPAGSNRSAGSLRLLAPMNGVIVNVLAKPDDPVAKGQCVVVLEAMKMQHEIVAERDGTIDKILVKPGDQVATRQLLAELKPGQEAAPPRQEAAS